MFELQAHLLDAWIAVAGGGPIRAPLPGSGGEVRDVTGRPQR
jgi:hypothetical protein